MSGTYISKKLRQKVAAQANYRCGYCLTSETIVGAAMEVEHIIPEAAGGSSLEANLWLSCSECNSYKSDRTQATDPDSAEKVTFFNPRQQVWSEHFEWSEDGGLILGKTSTGRVTIVALNLNRPRLVASRRGWAEVGWHPPVI